MTESSQLDNSKTIDLHLWEDSEIYPSHDLFVVELRN